MDFMARLKNIRSIKHLITISISLLLIFVGLTGCQSQASNDQLEQWHKAAIAENTRLTELYSSNAANNWILRVQGQVQKPITLNWSEIEGLADTTMSSVKAYSGNQKTRVKFKGILVEKLLKQAVVESGAEEVTIVASDSFYTTTTIKDLYFYQGLLAISENDKPIRRNEGGPVHMVFYNNPEDSKGTNPKGWTYYATHVIVGTEPLRLKVGNNILERADLEKLPTHKTTVLVGYQLGWKPEPVQLIGIKLRDILRSQNVTIPPKSVLKVRRKSMDDLDPRKSVKIPANLIDDCDVMLAYQWGTDSQNIPASKGGPLTLAYSDNCPREAIKNLTWLPFVESLSVETTEPKS
jgi:DMSO/TMAO reductase YedYZ molybdopterin-dependent catalytic subunit